MLDLQEIRKEIDEVDSELVKLLEKRMGITTKVAQFKMETGKAVLDREREKAKLESISNLVTIDANKRGMNEVFTQIMAASRKYQYSLLEANGYSKREQYEAVSHLDKTNCKVVYQGVEGAYAYIALKRFFGEDANCYNVKTWSEAMDAVERGEADYAVLPIENSTAGNVVDVFDLLAEYNNCIVAETYVKVDHALLGVNGTDISDVKTVCSHPQALMQCSGFFKEHKDIKQVEQTNTALSAKYVSEQNDKSIAAIASVEAAKLYGLSVLQRKVNTEEGNTTRFVIVSNKKMFLKDANKVSICFETEHTSGSLYEILSHIIYNGLNMTKIESRPIEGKAWEFRFFVDFTGNIDDVNVRNALRGIEEEALSIKLLGNY